MIRSTYSAFLCRKLPTFSFTDPVDALPLTGSDEPTTSFGEVGEAVYVMKIMKWLVIACMKVSVNPLRNVSSSWDPNPRLRLVRCLDVYCT